MNIRCNQVKKSLIPFAGKGIFAAQDFKHGDIVTVSPTFVLPKEGVMNIGNDGVTLVQNYCLASPDVANIAFFPFGLGAVANHASPAEANMVLEWHWWNAEDKEKKMQSTANDLSLAPFAQLDIAYRATRDIIEGEELTYDYGVEWADAWAYHLASLNQWHINSSVRDEAENDHRPPDQLVRGSLKPKFFNFIGASDHLFLPHWKAESAAIVAEAMRIAAEARAAEALATEALAAEKLAAERLAAEVTVTEELPEAAAGDSKEEATAEYAIIQGATTAN